jgi:hypothetical protein
MIQTLIKHEHTSLILGASGRLDSSDSGDRTGTRTPLARAQESRQGRRRFRYVSDALHLYNKALEVVDVAIEASTVQL